MLREEVAHLIGGKCRSSPDVTNLFLLTRLKNLKRLQ